MSCLTTTSTFTFKIILSLNKMPMNFVQSTAVVDDGACYGRVDHLGTWEVGHFGALPS